MARSAIHAFLLALLLVAALTTPALAHVHNISNAQCAPAGVLSGALQPASVNAPGRPAPQIPVTASDFRTQSQGGSFTASGTFCGPGL